MEPTHRHTQAAKSAKIVKIAQHLTKLSPIM